MIRKILRKLRSLPASRTDETVRDWQYLMANGLRSEFDLIPMALDRATDLRARQIACWFMARLLPTRLIEHALMKLAVATEEPTLLRCEAVHSLGLIGSRLSLPVLENLALHEEDRDVRESSVYALGFFSNHRTLKLLLSIAQNERETPRIRGEAIEQIGMVGLTTKGVLQALTALLRHKEVAISFWAAYALGQIGDTTVIRALSEVAMADGRELPPFGTLREEAERAIQMIHSRRT